MNYWNEKFPHFESIIFWSILIKKNLTRKKNIYNSQAFRKEGNICGYRLVVRTSGFHPGNRSSILRSRANTKLIKRTLNLN